MARRWQQRLELKPKLSDVPVGDLSRGTTNANDLGSKVRFAHIILSNTWLKCSIRSTRYNICVAVITIVLWFVRLCIKGHTLDLYGAVMSNALYDVILIALWSYSAVVQSSGDFSDPKHISLQPWCLNHQCKEAWPPNRSACAVVKASFGLTVFAVSVYPNLTGSCICAKLCLLQYLVWRSLYDNMHVWCLHVR